MSTTSIGPIDRFLFIGGGELAVNVANWCLSQGCDVKILTSPRHAEQTVGKNGETLLRHAEGNDIDIAVVSDIRSEEARAAIGNMDNTFALSLGAAWLFDENLLRRTFKYQLFNFHGTRLPENRGGGGFSWQILMGSRLGYCQLHRINAGIDTGNIFATHEFLYPASCRVPADYMAYYGKEGQSFLQSVFEKFIKVRHEFEASGQPEYLSSYWPRLHTESQAWIDWNMHVDALDRFVCAFDDPYDGAGTYYGGEAVRIKKSMADYSDASFHPFQYGLIYRKSSAWISVAANGGTLIVSEIWNEDGTSAFDQVKVGDRFFTPANLLEQKNQRVAYTPLGLKPSDTPVRTPE